MFMARHNAAELWGRAGQANLPARTAAIAPQTNGDLRSWARRSPVPAPLMILGGLGLAAIGVVGGWVLPLHLSWLGTALFGSAFTIGGGVAFLGAVKATSEPSQPALPAASSSVQVLTERSRRVHAILDRGGNFTFEDLLTQLRWTETALLETLVFMKDSGTMVEDLDLETGQWVYRAGAVDHVAPPPLTLADRQARQSLPEANG